MCVCGGGGGGGGGVNGLFCSPVGKVQLSFGV